MHAVKLHGRSTQACANACAEACLHLGAVEGRGFQPALRLLKSHRCMAQQLWAGNFGHGCRHGPYAVLGIRGSFLAWGFSCNESRRAGSNATAGSRAACLYCRRTIADWGCNAQSHALLFGNSGRTERSELTSDPASNPESVCKRV